MYAVYHGPQGLVQIANRVHGLAAVLAEGEHMLDVSVKRWRCCWLWWGQQVRRRLGDLNTPEQAIDSSCCRSCPAGAKKLGLGVTDAAFFDTVKITVGDAAKVVADAAAQGVNLRQVSLHCPARASCWPCDVACRWLRWLSLHFAWAAPLASPVVAWRDP